MSRSTIRCPKCGGVNPSDAKFCIFCGTALVPQQSRSTPGAYEVRYSLITPDGKEIEVVGEAIKVFGREDFIGIIPREYLILITRKSQGGHFTIACYSSSEGVSCYIRDDNSKNGTLVNGKQIKGAGWIKLNDGDIISPAGAVNLVFRFKK